MSVSFGDTPKSILKPTTKTGAALPSPAEARRIALTHATTLQIRKVLEASVLESLIHLLEFPLRKPSYALSSSPIPSRRDIRAFKFHLRFFTPGDYDDLIEERNIADRCGYTLCPKPRRKAKTQSRLARVAGGKWIESKDLERFCGEECARRALWVRVQLNTEPAWVRGEMVDGVMVDEDTGKVSGIELEAEEPEDNWDESISGFKLLEEAEEAKMGGVWREADENDVRKMAEELQGIGINDPGRLVTIGESNKKQDDDNAKTRNSDPGAILVNVMERRTRQVVITLPGDDDDDDDGERDLTGAIEGFIPKSKLKMSRKGKEKE